jgi:hypothetical protein
MKALKSTTGALRYLRQVHLRRAVVYSPHFLAKVYLVHTKVSLRSMSTLGSLTTARKAW